MIFGYMDLRVKVGSGLHSAGGSTLARAVWIQEDLGGCRVRGFLKGGLLGSLGFRVSGLRVLRLRTWVQGRRGRSRRNPFFPGPLSVMVVSFDAACPISITRQHKQPQNTAESSQCMLLENGSATSRSDRNPMEVIAPTACEAVPHVVKPMKTLCRLLGRSG